MSEHDQEQMSSPLPSSDLAWVGRWLGLAVAVFVVVTFAISCQQGQGTDAPKASTAAAGAKVTPVYAQETPAEGAAAPAEGSGEAAAPAAPVPDAKALGFSFASAPATPGRPG